MLRDPFTKWLWDGRRSVLVWALAIAGVGGMYAAFWPTIEDPEMQKAIESYPDSIREALNYTDISTPAGYLSATVYGLVVAMLMIVYAVGAGTRLIAGDEEAGTLDLVLAHPLSRRRLAYQRFAAFLVSIVVITVALLLMLLALTRPARLEGISTGGFVAMNLHLLLFAAVFGAAAYAVGAATGRRAPAFGAGAAIGVFGFAANGILPQVEGLEWIRAWSPFDWLNGEAPLKNGVAWVDVFVMAVLVLALVPLGTWAFERRDIAV